MKNKNPNNCTVCRNLRVERREICFFKYLLEAYEGIAVLETIDAKKGHIVLHTAPGCEAIVEDILSDLSEKYLIEDI
ncbi:MAG: DUF4911 domain-containing protein [Desulfobacteraceae bacterium]|nr:DUF4911 domain-containing protein [Desulfobacteraceae bacterium]